MGQGAAATLLVAGSPQFIKGCSGTLHLFLALATPKIGFAATQYFFVHRIASQSLFVIHQPLRCSPACLAVAR